MQTMEVNGIAAAQAISLIVGEPARAAIAATYGVIDGCMKMAYASGRADEQQAAHQNDDDYEAGYADGVEDGWKVGYDAGHGAATSTEQPQPTRIIMMPDTDVDGDVLRPGSIMDVDSFVQKQPYQGDSGDETKAMEDADLRDIPLFEAVFDWLVNVEFVDRDSADAMSLAFMRFWLKRIRRT